MKIGFLLGSPGISGGSYVIYEHASRLKRSGHQVAIITRQDVRPEEHAWHSSAAELNWLTIRQARTECFDIILATWWETAFLLRKLKSSHYAYFVQSIESRFFEPPDPQHYRNMERTLWRGLCEKTYACAIPMITEAAWIQEYLRRNYNNWPQLVRNGIRKDIYTAEGEAVEPRQPGRFRVLVEGPVEVFFKNVPAAVRLAKEAGAEEIWLLTSSNIKQYPDVDRVFSRVPIHETPAVYRSCDIVLKLSHIEGMFGPPLEMFHCGGTALVYDVTGHDEYIIHDRNAYVVKKDNEGEVVLLLRHLKENPNELARLKQGAAETAAAWPDWDACSAQFEQVLLNIAAGRSASRKYLQCWTRELFRSQKPFVHAKTQENFAAREKAAWKGAAADGNNFIRLSWDSCGQFIDGQSQWRHYLSGEWTTLSFELRAEELPLWFQLHLSCGIGIIDLAFIAVRNTTQNREIMAFREPDDFQILFLAKDLKWLFPERKNIVFSYGPHPIMLLPKIGIDQVGIGDTLEISIKLKETGVQDFFAGQEISIISKEAAENEGMGSNAMRLCWDSGGNFSREKSLRRHYPSEEWATLFFELRAEEQSLWLRLDPNLRACILEIASIIVRNTTQDREIMAFRQPDDFKILFLAGDLTWISPERRNIFLSSGANPVCILPQLKEGDADPGDLLEIAVRLKESSPQKFFSSYHVSLAEKNLPRWKRLLLLCKEKI